jgi:hypothetical protein
VVAVVAVVVAVASYLTWLAGRLDRLAVRAERSWAALDAALVRRSMVAHELAHLLGDPDLHASSRAPLHPDVRLREVAENALSRSLRDALPAGFATDLSARPHVLDLPDDVTSGAGTSPLAVRERTVLEDPEAGRHLLVELDSTLERLLLARHIYNDAVRDLLALRRRRLIRWLHLYGTAKAPKYFEIDSDLTRS